MLFRKKILLCICAMIACGEVSAPLSFASNLSEKQQLLQQLRTDSAQAAQDASKSQQRAETIKNNINAYQSLINNLNQEITTNQSQLQNLQTRLDQLNKQIAENQVALERDRQTLNQMLRVLYEDGGVPYLEVLFKATTFSDFLSRVQLLATITQMDNDLMQKVVSLNKTLTAQKKSEQDTYQALHNKSLQLRSLQQVDMNLQAHQKDVLTQVNQQIEFDTVKNEKLNRRLRLTQSQIAQMEQQVKEADAILSSNTSDVTEQNLRYQDIPPSSLYNYVRAQNSTFSLQDIQTICLAAQRYNVNPALLIAITGQEQAFVPPGPDAAQIRNNPFNVYYSWQVYNTSLADSANIAADTLRHKLSVQPPSGEDPILWINDPRNPWGIYATDTQWAYGVRRIFNDIMQTVHAG